MKIFFYKSILIFILFLLGAHYSFGLITKELKHKYENFATKENMEKLKTKVRKELKITIDLKSVLKYILTGIMVFSVSVIITEEFLIYNNSIFEFLPQLLLFTIIPITLYIIITYVIDRRTKNLIHAVIKEIRKLVV